MMRADMHIHTYYSDGAQSPRTVVATAKGRGVDLISVTDHDNACAWKEVSALAKAQDIVAVCGEEISAYDGEVKVHILGYNMDTGCAEYVAFHKKLDDGAEQRTADILKKLAAKGINIKYEDVLKERRFSQSPIHAMHIAAAGAKRGYASSPVDFYARYLNYGTAGFSCICRPSSEETVRFIKSCGGVCSLAHPGRISMEKEGVISLIERLKQCGMDGIEAVYSGHTATETQYYKDIAAKLNLLVTGGSDTHYAQGNRSIGTPLFCPDERLLAALGLKH